MNNTVSRKIKPYARLLTMLGEQLIKNERIALIELLKNAYDADADWVELSFLNFGDEYQIIPNSKIVILDNGCGMTSEVIEKHWLNPATPEKKLRKQSKDQYKTPKGRILQGEKGIGRFAILKLGRKIRIITKSENESDERVIEYDFSIYDDDFLAENGKAKTLFLDDLTVSITTRKPSFFTGKGNLSIGISDKQTPTHGTIIEISDLKGIWTEDKVKSVSRDIVRLQSIFPEKKSIGDFEVFIDRDGQHELFLYDHLEKLHVLLEDRAVFRIENGSFNSSEQYYSFRMNGTDIKLNLRDSDIEGLKVFRDRFIIKNKFDKKINVLDKRGIECGSFSFAFYIFDFTPQAPMKYRLDREDKDLIKSHRIYLYRDQVRVYPYGDPEDDWLKIDANRGTISAGQFLSNDQIIGYVDITQKENPYLIDKTNREGLIEQGNTTEDFIAIIQIFLSYIRQKPYARYRKGLESKKDQDIFSTEQILKDFDSLTNFLNEDQVAQAKDLLTETIKNYKTERNYLIQRAETTEELAGVGLSVETASHDIMLIMTKTLANIDGLTHNLVSADNIDKEQLINKLQTIRGGMGFIEAQLKDIQLLFKSSKQRRRNIRVKEIIEKVEYLYARTLKQESIKCTIISTKSPLIAKVTDAVLLQLLINLFDNSIYWLQLLPKDNKKIEIMLDGENGLMIFSDNGPGVNEEDAPYIFEPFYSGKGAEGRGLGLYIARKLLERNDYSIGLAEIRSEKRLSGANFVIHFIAEDSSNV